MALPAELPTDLSELQYTKDGFIYVPIHIFEDSLTDNDFLVPLKRTAEYVVFKKEDKDLILQERLTSYAASVWFPLVQTIIPTAPGTMSTILSIAHLKVLLDIAFAVPNAIYFVRLGTMSPKDVINPPVFTTAQTAYAALLASERTRHDLVGNHLFLREVRTYAWEARCFWSRDALTAVCLPYERDLGLEQTIVDFFITYGEDIPYHSAVVDIGFNEATGGIELIEFNSFGPDLNATAGRFNWQEDYYLLLFPSGTVTFRGMPTVN